MKIAALVTATFFSSIVAATSLAGRDAAPVQDEREDAIAHGEIVHRNNCLMCHSPELVESQRLTEAQWEAEITKMVGWGAPVAKDEEADLLLYLAGNFGPDRPKNVPKRASLADLRIANEGAVPEPNPANLEHGAKLYAIHCASCHGATGLGGEVGTNLVEKPILLRPEAFHEVVRKGRNKMPGFEAALDKSGENDVLSWLARLPSEGAKPPG